MTGSNTRRCPIFGQSGGEVISSTIEAAAIAVAKPLKRCEAGVFVMGRVSPKAKELPCFGIMFVMLMLMLMFMLLRDPPQNYGGNVYTKR